MITKINFHNKLESQTILKEKAERGEHGSFQCFTHSGEYIFDAVILESFGLNHRIDYFYKEPGSNDLPFHIGEKVWVA